MVEKKILIIDDEEMICDIVGESFSKNGYVVRTAGSAEEGLEILKNEDFPVIFLDLNLPVMSGVEMCRHIRKTGSKAVIYAVTGYSSVYGIEACNKAGFNNFFIKPVKLNVLLKAAEEAFDNLDKSNI
jgi:CheY-like chemotaxis protein